MNNDAAYYRKITDEMNSERVRKATCIALDKVEKFIANSAMQGKSSTCINCTDVEIVGPVIEALKAKGFNVHVKEHENPYDDDFSATITMTW